MPRISHDKTSVALRAIADPHRREILSMLSERGQCSLDKPVGMCAADIEGRMKLTQPTISHHMRILVGAGLVQATKIGQWRWYKRNEPAIKELARGLRGL